MLFLLIWYIYADPLICENGGILELSKRPTCYCGTGWKGISCGLCDTDDVCGVEEGEGGRGGGICDRNLYVGPGKRYECNVETEDFRNGLGQWFDIRCIEGDVCLFYSWGSEGDPLEYRKVISCTGYNISSSYNPDNDKITVRAETIDCHCHTDSVYCNDEFIRNILLNMDGAMELECGIYSHDCILHQDNLPNSVELQCVGAGCLSEYVKPPPNVTFLTEEFREYYIESVIGTILFYFILLLTLVACILTFKTDSIRTCKRMIEKHQLRNTLIYLQFYISSITVGNKEIIHSTGTGIAKEKEGLIDIPPGAKVGLLGKKGSGKTTMISFLAGHSMVPVVHSGSTVRVNGIDRRNLPCYKRLTGYILQNDFKNPSFTVNEELLYSASLRNSRSGSDITSLIRNIKSNLGLSHLSHRRQGLSGGESKVLFIARELVAEPEILYLDEPLTGMGETAGLKVLQYLSKTDGIIISSFHESRNDHLLTQTHIMVMDDGHMVLYAKRKDVFDALKIKEGDIQVGEYLLQEGHAKRLGQQLGVCRPKLGEDIQPITDNGKEWWNFLSCCLGLGPDRVINLRRISPFQTTMVHQIFFLFYREMKEIVHDWTTSIVHTVTWIIAMTLFCTIFRGHIGATEEGLQNRIGFFQLVIVFVSLMGIIGIIQTGETRKKIFLREYHTGYYSKETYFYVTMCFRLIQYYVLQPIIFGTLLYGTVGLRWELESYLSFILILCIYGILSFFAAVPVGILFSPYKALFIFFLITTFNVATTGLAVNLSEMGPSVSWIGWLGFSRYPFSIWITNEMQDDIISYQSEGMNKPMFIPSEDFLNTLGIYYEQYTLFVDIIILWLFFSFLLSWLFFRFCMK